MSIMLQSSGYFRCLPNQGLFPSAFSLCHFGVAYVARCKENAPFYALLTTPSHTHTELVLVIRSVIMGIYVPLGVQWPNFCKPECK